MIACGSNQNRAATTGACYQLDAATGKTGDKLTIMHILGMGIAQKKWILAG
ncbi:MAG: hypothetical protein ABI813_01175 [Bacteroidota bacterium]